MGNLCHKISDITKQVNKCFIEYRGQLLDIFINERCFPTDQWNGSFNLINICFILV